MAVVIEESWKKKLGNEFDQAYFQELAEFVKKEYKDEVVYPGPKFIFRAFDLCPFDKVKVVILGQDPYHGPKQANGLSFAVNEGVTLPPSLQNIFKEIASDFQNQKPFVHRSGDLSRWATQGVLLLNATLTVRGRMAGSHQGHGWERFTDAVISALSNEREHLVFILWGTTHDKRAHTLIVQSILSLNLRTPHRFLHRTVSSEVSHSPKQTHTSKSMEKRP